MSGESSPSSSTPGPLSDRDIAVRGTALALLFEAVTVFARFGLGLQSTRDTRHLAALTSGFRIHHGYVGALLLLAACRMGPGMWRDRGLILGVALLVSDLVHHFGVLWWITGDPQFDLRY